MPLVQSSHSQVQRFAACAIIAAGLLLRWPVLYTGFTVDDYAQLAMIRGTYPVQRAPLSLFTFSDGSSRENTRLREVGFFPWWSDPHLRVSLLRPLSSALMWFDARVLGNDAFTYHLHSAAWWIAMMLALWEFLRRVTPGWTSVLALGLITAHPAHTVLLGWIANRNALVATTFALLGLIAQLRAQRESWRLGYLVALGAYTLGLLASEYAIATLAFGLTLAVFRPDSPAQRARVLAIWFGSAAVYLALRAGLGYGTRGSGMYIDPLREPLAFLSAAAQRYPVLVGDAVLAVRSGWWSSGLPWAWELANGGWIPPLWAADLRPLRSVYVSIGTIACLVCGGMSWRWLRRNADQTGPDLRFLALGVPIAFLPSAASLPESRLMLPGLIGWAALLAETLALELAIFRATKGALAALRCIALASLVTLETLVPPWSSADEIKGMPRLAQAVRASILAPNLDPLMGGRRHVLLAAAVDPTTTIYMGLVRSWHERPTPASCQLLLGGWGRLRLTRISPSAFVLERLTSHFTAPDVYASAFNRNALHRGDHFQSGDLEVLVEHVHDGRPMRVRYELHQPLEPLFTLIVQTEHGLRPVEFPAVGQPIFLEPAAPPLRLHETNARARLVR